MLRAPLLSKLSIKKYFPLLGDQAQEMENFLDMLSEDQIASALNDQDSGGKMPLHLAMLHGRTLNSEPDLVFSWLEKKLAIKKFMACVKSNVEAKNLSEASLGSLDQEIEQLKDDKKKLNNGFRYSLITLLISSALVSFGLIALPLVSMMLCLAVNLVVSSCFYRRRKDKQRRIELSEERLEEKKYLKEGLISALDRAELKVKAAIRIECFVRVRQAKKALAAKKIIPARAVSAQAKAPQRTRSGRKSGCTIM